MFGYVHVRAIAHVWETKDSLQESVAFFHQVGFRDGAQVSRLGRKCLYPLSHLAAPQKYFLKVGSFFVAHFYWTVTWR